MGHHELIEAHLGLTRKAALMIYPRVKKYMELEELVAFGNVGLAEAATRYDAKKGASFSTFAWYRIHGTIMDALRSNSSMPRRVWRKLVALRAAADYLEQQGARGAPSERTQTLAQIRNDLSAIRTMYVTSLDGMREHGFEPVAQLDRPDDKIAANQSAARLRKAVDCLPEKERALIVSHYFEGKNLAQAGAAIGISKSWASRLHAQGVDRLRVALAA